MPQSVTELLTLDELNTKLIQNKSLLFSQGFFFTDIEKNGEGFLLQRAAHLIDFFIDGGCNKGDVSKYIYKFNRNINFHLFDIFDIEHTDFNPNFIKHNKVILSDKVGSELIYTLPKSEKWNSSEVSSLYLRDDYNCKNSEFIKIELPSISLDSYSKNFPKESSIFLKLDIEGAEIRCLKGAKNFLAEYNVSGYLEYNPTAWKNGGFSYKDLYRMMFELDFKLFRITPLGLKEISYYSEINETLFCYYFFCKNEFLKAMNLKEEMIERKTGINKSRLYVF